MNTARKFSTLGVPALLTILVVMFSAPAWADQGSVHPEFKSRAPIYPGSVVVAKEKFNTNYTLKTYPVILALLTSDPPQKVRAFYDRQGIGKLELSPERQREHTQFEERQYFMALPKDRKFIKQKPEAKFLEVHYRTPPEPERSSPLEFAKGAGNLFQLFQGPLLVPETKNNPDFDFGKVYDQYRHLRSFYLEPAKFQNDLEYRTYMVVTVADRMRKKYEKVDPSAYLATQQPGNSGDRSSSRRSRRNDDRSGGSAQDQAALQAKIAQLMQQGKFAEAQALMTGHGEKRKMSRAERRQQRAERRAARKRERQHQSAPLPSTLGIYKNKWQKGQEYLEAVSRLPLYRTRIVIRGNEPRQ